MPPLGVRVPPLELVPGNDPVAPLRDGLSEPSRNLLGAASAGPRRALDAAGPARAHVPRARLGGRLAHAQPVPLLRRQEGGGDGQGGGQGGARRVPDHHVQELPDQRARRVDRRPDRRRARAEAVARQDHAARQGLCGRAPLVCRAEQPAQEARRRARQRQPVEKVTPRAVSRRRCAPPRRRRAAGSPNSSPRAWRVRVTYLDAHWRQGLCCSLCLVFYLYAVTREVCASAASV
mmetsp:Transcript_7542/g.22349  ORF Transcript_7542/g.22349 Transcript_7542/m.22349 type:complete len:234 (+) Transcript_7542:114-815(+)